MTHNPHIAPDPSLEPVKQDLSSTPLWNPNFASAWSLLFTPVFGAIIHMKNWEALGRPDKAMASKVWAFMMGVIILLVTTWSILNPRVFLSARLPQIVSLTVFFVWYVAMARPQIDLITAAGDFEKRSWGMPISLGIAGIAALLAFVMMLDGRQE